MRKYHGYIQAFTLIEILIALSVFAILATVTSSILYDSFKTKEIISEHADNLGRIQIAITLLDNDTRQIIDRPIVTDNSQTIAAFVGRPDYLSFTREGITNPLALEKRSTLRRVALMCQGDKLIRRSWDVLDPPNIKRYDDKLLLDNLNSCYFRFLNRSLSLLDEWHERAVGLNQKPEPIPQAIQLNIDINHWGKANLLFLIPEAAF
jgi:general secretion pathway protein J